MQRYLFLENGIAEKEKNPTSNRKSGFHIIMRTYSVISASTGLMETKDLLSFFFVNSTMPSHKAYKVWSLPMPTFLPG